MFKFEMEKCYFCKTSLESTEHLFFECEIVGNFWKDINNWFQTSPNR